ncbi:MAG: hypothetical protein LBN05_01880 [Oscillospiraceae bacterium]|jgi:ABC-type phosphonate transport system ATPase subunit|nr:hypothetical protein [Oscillospiraceae bacterium]
MAIQLILGGKGSGKTKQLLAGVEAALDATDGNVVVVDKCSKLSTHIPPAARVVATDEYGVAGYAALYGFLSGIAAGNYDITDVFVDATLRIAGDDREAALDNLGAFLAQLDKLSTFSETNFVLTISEDKDKLPAGALVYAK